MTRTATGRAFAALTSDFRVGFTTISDTGVTNGTNKFVDIGDYTAAKKTAFYSSLYTATGSSNTPLRGALAKVGRYFANKAPGQASDPMQYSCQRNYAILSTDGYWNTGSETTSYGPNQLTTNTAVGQQDAGEAKPMWDGTHTIVTAVTPYTTVTRKQTISTRTDTANMRRYAYPVPGSKGGGSCSNSEYRIRVQQQNSTTSTPVSITSVDDVTSVYNNTVVTTDGVITSNTNSTPTNTGTVNVSSTTTNGTPSSGAWSNSGGTTDYCRTAAQLTAAGMLVNTTYYSSTNAPTYTAISANGVQTSSSTGSVTAGTPTILSTNGPTAGTTISTPSTSGGASSTLADVAEYYYATDLRTAALNNCTGSVGPDGSTHDVCSNSTMLPMPPLDVATHQHMTTYTIGLGVNGTLAYDPNYLSQTSGAYVQLTSGAITWPVPASTSNGGDARNIDDLWHAARQRARQVLRDVQSEHVVQRAARRPDRCDEGSGLGGGCGDELAGAGGRGQQSGLHRHLHHCRVDRRHQGLSAGRHDGRDRHHDGHLVCQDPIGGHQRRQPDHQVHAPDHQGAAVVHLQQPEHRRLRRELPRLLQQNSHSAAVRHLERDTGGHRGDRSRER